MTNEILADPYADDTPLGWLITPSSNLVGFLAEQMKIAGLTQRALIGAQGVPGYLAAIEHLAPLPDAEKRDAMRRLRSASESDAAFAKEEIEADFNTVMTYHAIATWAAVETAIEQSLVNLVRKVPSSAELIMASAPLFKAAKIRTTTVRDAANTVRNWEMVLPPGTVMEKADQMLGAFGLTLTLPEPARRDLSELAELRNVLLHNGRRLDQKFLDKCPWRQGEVGDLVRVSNKDMDGYFAAARLLAIDLMGQITRSPFVAIRD